ncbi:unnamed protein product [Angiostrongylus costaricensis]|uniref:Shootin-1 n=1 Tax=Angiostrongylus costaricensis TaxID=334426 RepID=A0A0R3Q1I9_ANGCS|nr:unnamed protein product [Angiostrongylus costaricensis]
MEPQGRWAILDSKPTESRSDEDDTWEKLASLIEEFTKRSHKRTVKLKKVQKDKGKVEKDGVEDVMNVMKEAVKKGVNPVVPQKLPK